MRTIFFSLAAAIATLGCGDDTGDTSTSSTGGGGTTTSGSTSTGSTGEGGAGSTTTTGNGGGPGQGGGTTATTTSGAGGFEPADTVQEACENFNAITAAIADELGCTTEPGDCDAPVDECEAELLDFINCLVAETERSECACVGGEGGASGEGAQLDCTGVASVDCTASNDALEECLQP